ncbi:2-dehydropantoate 2-reductase [Candidatus Gracilibacteria bacterium]|nr:2-dehydropantoate 2-reductase [Candidatus Gracilibacteria bacterium]
MKICIVGAGAIGGYIGGKLALAGADVTLIARGAHLAAIQQHGLTIIESDGRRQTVRPALATANMAEVGPHDLVIVAVKAHSLPPIATDLRALYGPETVVLTAQNGIPWWYFYGQGGPHEGQIIQAVDPGGVIAANTEIARVVGGVVYIAAEIGAPGVILHSEANRLTLGEPDGSKSARVERIAQLLIQAGLRAPIRSNIRDEIWVKLWGNLSFNPISALTRATLNRICFNPHTRALAAAMMAEAQTVGEAVGARFGISIEQRIKAAEEVGAHKTSMLQDIEAGRPTELDALLGSVIELGRLVGVQMPNCAAVYACVKLLDERP